MKLKKLKRVIRVFLSTIDRIIYCLFKNTTKIDKDLIIFEGMMGRFDESCRVLYHHLSKKGKYHFIWMVKKPSSYPSLKNTKFVNRFHLSFNIIADYYYAKAGFSFYTHATSPIRYKRDGQKKIYIGHGYAIKGGKNNGKDGFNNFDYALTIGKNAISSHALFIGCNEQALLPLGLPRNDLLIKNNGQGILNPLVKGKTFKFKKVILWMPTFRESKIKVLSENTCATSTGLPLFDTNEKVYRLNDILQQLGCLILLKIHPLQMGKELFKKHFSNIAIITNVEIDITKKQLYEIIGYSDALLTDYSSVSVDYLLLDKPIGYILNDFDYYKKDRGFTSDNPLELMAGDYIYTENDCLQFISKVIENIDDKKEQRRQLVNKLHDASKGNSCQLIEKFFFT